MVFAEKQILHGDPLRPNNACVEELPYIFTSGDRSVFYIKSNENSVIFWSKSLRPDTFN